MDDGYKHYYEKDGCHSWMVFAAAFLCNMLSGGIMMAPAQLLVEWYSTYDRPKSVTSWLPSVMVITRSLTGFFVGGLINRFGCRLVQICGCILSCIGLLAGAWAPSFEMLSIALAVVGVGCGLALTPPIVIIFDYFEKHKALACGLSLAGLSVSSLVMVSLYSFSINMYGWRGAMVIMAGTMLNCCVPAMFFVRNSPKPPIKSGIYQAVDLSLFTNLNFVLIIVVNSLSGWTIDIMYLMSTSRAVSKGMDIIQASMLISCVGMASTVGKLPISWISNLKCTSHIALYISLVFVLSALSALTCLVTSSFAALAAMTAMAGLSIGGLAVLYPAVLVDIVSSNMIADALGLNSAVTYLFRSASLPAAGLVYDLTKDFNNSFYLSAVISLIAAVIGLIVVARVHCASRLPPDPHPPLPIHVSAFDLSGSYAGSQALWCSMQHVTADNVEGGQEVKKRTLTI